MTIFGKITNIFEYTIFFGGIFYDAGEELYNIFPEYPFLYEISLNYI